MKKGEIQLLICMIMVTRSKEMIFNPMHYTSTWFPFPDPVPEKVASRALRMLIRGEARVTTTILLDSILFD